MSVPDQFLDTRAGLTFKKQLPLIRARLARRLPVPTDSKYGVTGTTLRAFHDWAKPPGKTYRAWAARVTKRTDWKAAASMIRSRAGFVAWHGTLAQSLARHWRKAQGGRAPSFAHIHKLIDLYVKWLAAADVGPAVLSARLIRNGNAALDKKILTVLNRCYSNALPLTNPSIRSIHCRTTYDFCQILIDKFARRQGGTRLLFDFYAWPLP